VLEASYQILYLARTEFRAGVGERSFVFERLLWRREPFESAGAVSFKQIDGLLEDCRNAQQFLGLV